MLVLRDIEVEKETVRCTQCGANLIEIRSDVRHRNTDVCRRCKAVALSISQRYYENLWVGR